jgi:hypothetical protein
MTAQEHAIAAGNVVRTTWPVSGAPLLPLYQGSGRSGACWNAWGLMGPVDDADPQAWDGPIARPRPRVITARNSTCRPDN